MARVFFPDRLAQLTHGERELEVSASNFRELLLALEKRFPGIEASIVGKVAVAIDGDIVLDPYLDPIRPDSEIFFLQRIEGG